MAGTGINLFGRTKFQTSKYPGTAVAAAAGSSLWEVCTEAFFGNL